MLLEGALFEGRIGNQAAARTQFRILMDKCQTYGPLYFEASRYEEREGQFDESLKICEEGLDFNPKYGPLWFQYLRLYEKFDGKTRVAKFESLQTVFNEMFDNVPKELDWKIYIEAA
jgi:tetratricopeptide (TPR) repeat protein